MKNRYFLVVFLLLTLFTFPFLTTAQTISVARLGELFAQLSRIQAQLNTLLTKLGQSAAIVNHQTLTGDQLVINSSSLIVPNDLGSQDQFATSLALDGNTAILGAPRWPTALERGAAYVITSATGWATTTQKLVAPDGASGHRFGSAVAVDDSWTVVGAGGAGAAYVYELVGSTWTYRQKLLPAPSTLGDFFGSAVAIVGTKMFVGAYGANFYAGQVFVFNYNGSSWVQTQVISTPNPALYDFFGFSLTASGETLAIGSYGEDGVAGTNYGSVYIYNLSGDQWVFQQKIKASDGGSGDNFGAAVSLDNNLLVVGANFNDGVAADAGAAYVFSRNGNQWNFQTKLTGSDSGSGSSFGRSVAVKGNLIVVGSPYWDDPSGGGIEDRGAVYPFVFSGGTWAAQVKLSTPMVSLGSDRLGNAVSIIDNIILAGANMASGVQGNKHGEAYIFNYSIPMSTTTFTLTASAIAGGIISPSGTTTVNQGANQTYTFTPNTGYGLSHIIIDGVPLAATTTYIFDNIQTNHAVGAVFVLNGGSSGSEPCSTTNTGGLLKSGGGLQVSDSISLQPCTQ